MLVTEDFNYAPGTLLTATGNWAAHSGAGTNAIAVTSSGLSYPGYLGSGIGNAASMTTSGEDDHTTVAFTAKFGSGLLRLHGQHFRGPVHGRLLRPLLHEHDFVLRTSLLQARFRQSELRRDERLGDGQLFLDPLRPEHDPPDRGQVHVRQRDGERHGGSLGRPGDRPERAVASGLEHRYRQHRRHELRGGGAASGDRFRRSDAGGRRHPGRHDLGRGPDRRHRGLLRAGRKLHDHDPGRLRLRLAR